MRTISQANVQKYFKQRSWTIPEIACLIVAVPSAVCAFIDGLGWFGIPLALVSIIALVFLKSLKVKDAEIDGAFDELIGGAMDRATEEGAIKCYDLTDSHIVRGADGKIRTSRRILSVYSFDNTGATVTVYTFDILAGSSERSTHRIPRDASVTLSEEEVMLPGGKQTAQYLVCSGPVLKIPVSNRELHASEILEKICA